MCQRCLDNSVINLNNAEAVLKLAQAAHTLDSFNAAAEKNAVLRRIDDIVELPRTAGEAGSVGEQASDNGKPEAATEHPVISLIRKMAADAGISVEFVHLP